jgi:hypothetical protein
MRTQPQNRLKFALFVAAILIGSTGQAAARPVQPGFARVIGDPARWSAYWHDQRWVAGDEYACALYAQASVLAALGYSFDTELKAARDLGQQDGWFDPDTGTLGLGQPLRARGITFDVFGSPAAAPIRPERALARLEWMLLAGRLAIANLDAQQLTYYRGSAIHWHTLWITGLRLDDRGTITAVITNDSTHGAAVEYPAEEFLAAWGAFNYYAIFVHDR